MQPNDQKSFLSDETSFQISIFFFVITRIVALLFSFRTITDITLYFQYHTMFSHGLIPYVHFDFEYQPLSLIPILLSGFATDPSDITYYYLSFLILMLAFDSLNLFLSMKLSEKYHLNKSSISFMILAYSILSLVLFKLLYHRLDIVVCTFILLSIIIFLNNKKGLLYLTSYLGFFYKIIPAINLPAAIIINEYKQGISNYEYIKKITIASLKFILRILVTMITLQIFASKYIYSILYHSNRGIQVESLYSSIVLFFNFITNNISHIIISHKAFNIVTHPLLEITAKYLGFIILGIFYLFVLIKKTQNKIKRDDFLDISLIIFLIFISFQRVLSPQFLIWIIPLLSIHLSINKSNVNFSLICLIYLVTAIIFYPNYFSLINQEPILINLLLLRNLLLIFITFKIFSNLLRKTNDR